MNLSAVPDELPSTLDLDEAQAVFQQHWEQARAEYAQVIQAVGGHHAATLIERRYKLTPREVEEAANWARDLAHRAHVLSTVLDRADGVTARVARP